MSSKVLPVMLLLATIALPASAVLACEALPSREANQDDTRGSVESAVSVQSAAVQAFDGERAMQHAREMVGYGPRPVGSEELEKTRVYIEEALRGYGLEVRRDEFNGDTPVGEIPMANLIVEIPAATGPTDRPIVILAGHYDTKLFEVFDFVGANDGASSAAVLLEVGRVLAEHPPPLPVWLVFFDGEEAVVQWDARDKLYGSRYMAAKMEEEGRIGDIGALILFDMVGDRDLEIYRELNSTPWLTELIWTTAVDVGHGDHFSERTHAIDDDHMPFAVVGVPVIDLIDFSYGPGNRYWHAPFDTIDKIGADSLQAVGQTVLAALPALAEQLAAVPR